METPLNISSPSQAVTVTWQEFSPKYVMPMGGVCAAPGWGALGAMPAAGVSTPSLFAKVSGPHVRSDRQSPEVSLPLRKCRGSFWQSCEAYCLINEPLVYICMLRVTVLRARPCHLPSFVFSALLFLLPGGRAHGLWSQHLGTNAGSGQEVVPG